MDLAKTVVPHQVASTREALAKQKQLLIDTQPTEATPYKEDFDPSRQLNCTPVAHGASGTRINLG